MSDKEANWLDPVPRAERPAVLRVVTVVSVDYSGKPAEAVLPVLRRACTIKGIDPDAPWIPPIAQAISSGLLPGGQLDDRVMRADPSES
jgi:hypothetical protein